MDQDRSFDDFQQDDLDLDELMRLDLPSPDPDIYFDEDHGWGKDSESRSEDNFGNCDGTQLLETFFSVSASNEDQNSPVSAAPLGYGSPSRRPRKQPIQPRVFQEEREFIGGNDNGAAGNCRDHEFLHHVDTKKPRKATKKSEQSEEERIQELIEKPRKPKGNYHLRAREIINLNARSFDKFREQGLYELLQRIANGTETGEDVEKARKMLEIFDDYDKIKDLITQIK